jgi:hypothetical protein
MNRRLHCLALALSLVAAPLLAEEPTSVDPGYLFPPGMGVTLLLGLPMGDTADDLSKEYGYGISAYYPWHLGGRHMLRPHFEFTAYPVKAATPPSWAAGNEQEDPDYECWRLGIDYVIYKEPNVVHGPYAFVTAGIQYSSIEFQVENESHTALSTHEASNRSPYMGLGFGWQFNRGTALEIRYSRAEYEAEKGEPLGSYTLTETEERDGDYIHLILSVRTPF